jgi:predicted AlkP superfamily phosphohydrolase/phosphomutase
VRSSAVRPTMRIVAARLLLLGLDAFDAELMQRWTAEGKLPAIRGLMERGTSGLVRGPAGFYVGSSWATFYTGLNPAGHGFYRMDQLAPGTYDFFRPVDRPAGIGGTPIWTKASAAGLRVAAFDIPTASVDRKLNGIQIGGWGDFEGLYEYMTSPPELAAEILAAVGEYPRWDVAEHRRGTSDEFAHLVAALEQGVEKRTALTLELLDREDWDLFIQVFTESHSAGHQCWHLHDPTSPSHDPEIAAAIGNPVERVYCAIDRAVGAILERAGDAGVMLFAVYGMSSWRGAGFLLREILYRLGVTTSPTVQIPRLHEALYRLGVTAHPAYLRLRKRFARTSPSSTSYRHPANVLGWADVDTSRCFSIPNGKPVGGIRLNLAGREPRGTMQPGREADAFCEQLTEDLLAIVDERTDSPLIAKVDRTNMLYTGPRVNALPDLLVEWNSNPTGTSLYAGGRGATVRARSEAIGIVEGQNDYHRTGDHLPRGFYVYAGRGIPVAERKEPVELTDLYPTICTLLGLADPGVDGALIPELVAAR